MPPPPLLKPGGKLTELAASGGPSGRCGKSGTQLRSSAVALQSTEGFFGWLSFEVGSSCLSAPGGHRLVSGNSGEFTQEPKVQTLTRALC